MSYHRDREINNAIVRLLDALCSWERNTGRRSVLLLIPYEADEPIIFAEDGKPVDGTRWLSAEDFIRYLKIVLEERRKGGDS